ncbi:helix-turn-helix transcriptional regulator [Nostoc ellipsosporum NOK]|nr:helix-turn-helix transcriptional regulator [Nostoc ellipsosporum NOK]
MGEAIRERRELLKLLQPELAAIAGVGLRTLQQVEKGKANPSITTLLKIIDPLGLTIRLALKETGTGEKTTDMNYGN